VYKYAKNNQRGTVEMGSAHCHKRDKAQGRGKSMSAQSEESRAMAGSLEPVLKALFDVK
jgi:hypothetical protein